MTGNPLGAIRDYWNTESDRFDDEPDHGLADLALREAWRARLVGWLPPAPSRVLDLGCGTGSLSLLLTELGHEVLGIDLAERMVEHARAKCAGRRAEFHVGDAADPDVRPGSVDAVLARHVLWTLPDPHEALRRWVDAVRPGGRLVLVEGRWSPGDADGAAPDAGLPWAGGVRAETLTAALDPLVDHLEMVCLTHDPTLWGRTVDDERYAVVAVVPEPPRG